MEDNLFDDFVIGLKLFLVFIVLPIVVSVGIVLLCELFARAIL